MNNFCLDCGLDVKFLEQQHGFSTCGQLPLDRMGKVKNKQGVELATNIDLSEWTAVELRNLGKTSLYFNEWSQTLFQGNPNFEKKCFDKKLMFLNMVELKGMEILHIKFPGFEEIWI